MGFLPGSPGGKDELTAGRVNADFAAGVGARIAAVHAATANSAADRTAFPTDAMFRALRVDPFLLHVADRDAELAPVLRALADDLSARMIALVQDRKSTRLNSSP